MKKAKAESNKQNALLSTGPKDTSKTRYNAVKHGLLSTRVAPHEQAMYDATLEEFRNSAFSENAIDDFLIRRMALQAVRLERYVTLGAQLADDQMREEVAEPKKRSTLDYLKIYLGEGSPVQPGSLAELGVALQGLTGLLPVLEDGANQEDQRRAVAAVESLTAALDKLPRKPTPKPWEISGEAEKLHRYEVACENRFIKLLNELERLKRLRRGENIPAPLSINVTHHEGGDV